MTKPRLVVTESAGMSDAAVATLRGVADVRLLDCADRDALLAAAGDADGLWVRLRHRIDAGVLDAAPALRLVATPTTGHTHVDVDALRERGIQLLSLRGDTELLDRIPATAEHTLLLLLALLRRVVPAAAHAAAGGRDRDRYRGHELAGRTVGLLGFGRLGRLVARRLVAFDARVLAHDPAVDHAGNGVELVALADLLSRSDALVVLASYEPGAPPALGPAELSACRRGALLVNTARGELVDEEALVDALRSGAIGGAALDVLADEHDLSPDRPLLALARAEPDRVLVTPHIGGATAESMAATEEHLATKVAAWWT